MAAASGQDLAYLIQAARDRSQGAARALQTQWGKPPHEGHSRVLSDDPDTIVPRRSQACACCGASLHAALPAEIISVAEQIELPAVAPIVTQYQRFAVCCPSCGTRVIAPSPEAARGTPFDPRLHAVATYLKTLQALSYERL